jgi:hypothetical protein
MNAIAAAAIASGVTFVAMWIRSVALLCRLRESALEAMQADEYADRCNKARRASNRENVRLHRLNDHLVRIAEESVGRIPDQIVAASLYADIERATAREFTE